jgi:HAD superfamily hydrolase (TIGR01509 family)
MKTLVLDAMGVIYQARDDVVELLCPFIHQRGGIADDREIEALYIEASLGHLSARQFWQEVQVDPNLEDDYLRRHRLSPGLNEFLRDAKPHFDSIWCLSNDVSQWSRKLREFFDLQTHIDGFVISGDVGVRKPEMAIYVELLSQAMAPVESMIFVDDRLKNLGAAAALGLATILFDSTGSARADRVVNNFSQLIEIVIPR